MENQEGRPVLTKEQLVYLREGTRNEINKIFDDAKRFKKGEASKEEKDEYYKKAASKANALYRDYDDELKRYNKAHPDDFDTIAFIVFLPLYGVPVVGQIAILFVSMPTALKVMFIIIMSILQLVAWSSI